MWIRWKEERDVKIRKMGVEGRKRMGDEKERGKLMWRKEMPRKKRKEKIRRMARGERRQGWRERRQEGREWRQAGKECKNI